MGAAATNWRERYRALPYIIPFALFYFFFLAAQRFGFDAYWDTPLRVVVLGTACAVCWPREIAAVPKYWVASGAIGLAVFAIWIAPELIFPGYRDLRVFSNAFIPRAHSSISPDALNSGWVLFWRTARAVIVVPFIEELFWRGWMMRWLVNTRFETVPIGVASPAAFWITALLFASEHGAYWDVGLIAGIIYNLWIIRSKSLADCILAHAVTNAALTAYIIGAHQWQYWQ